MEELKIELTYNPQDFREIYYQNGQGSLFTYKPTQKAIIYFFSAALFICVIYFVSHKVPGISWLLVLALFGLLITGINMGITVYRYLRWKADTESYIKGFAQYKSFHIQLSPGAIEFTQDSTTTIDKWDSITAAHFFENYIMVYQEHEAAYFIPAKSMKPDEFIKLKNFISNKIKVEAQ